MSTRGRASECKVAQKKSETFPTTNMAIVEEIKKYGKKERRRWSVKPLNASQHGEREVKNK